VEGGGKEGLTKKRKGKIEKKCLKGIVNLDVNKLCRLGRSIWRSIPKSEGKNIFSEKVDADRKPTNRKTVFAKGKLVVYPGNTRLWTPKLMSSGRSTRNSVESEIVDRNKVVIK
jgi:hypothetical protein